MADPADVPRILKDAARLVRRGELVVFGSAALAFWLEDPPTSRDVDLWAEPPERGQIVEALMGELSWYHDKHGVWAEVWAPETFAAPSSWRARARTVVFDDLHEVRVLAPHPHDILVAKLERMDAKDREHITRISAEFPLSPELLAALVAECPFRDGRVSDPERIARFEYGLELLQRDLLRSD